MTDADIEFLTSLLGKPWRSGAFGPEAYDCWNLVAVCQRRLFSRDLPIVSEPPVTPVGVARLIRDHGVRKMFRVVPNPVHGCVVEMARVERPFHVGVFLEIDRGGVLHCDQGGGVCFDPLFVMRASGWQKMVFNDWNG